MPSGEYTQQLEIVGDAFVNGTETVIWTNPSPTATTFANQVVTLSDFMSNYNYIKCKYRLSGVSGEFISIADIDTVKRATAASASKPIFGISGYPSSGGGYIRYLLYNADNKISFTVSYQINGTATGNTQVIPLEIVGIRV